MRNLPQLPESLEVTEPKARDDMITQTRQYSLITPLFGGGVEPNKPDPVTVVRATAIRGHLRFWWRACRGGQFNGDLAKMKAYEDALWGAAAKEDSGGPSQVVVVVKDGKRGGGFKVKWSEKEKRSNTYKKVFSTEVGHHKSPYSYVAFPLNEDRGEVYEEVKFSLDISYPKTICVNNSEWDVESEIQAALWAWETFGGIGARTRRGSGALRLEQIDGQPHTDLPPANESQARDWLKRKLGELVVGQFHEDVPHVSLETRYRIVSQDKDGKALKEWEKLINKLKKFRQRRYTPEGEENDHGHSGWPEPNTIRRVFEKDSRGPFADRSIDKFPRAQFGLPIIFHMAHDRSIGDVTLQGKEKDRLASPLILKPLACQDNKALGLALILEGVNLPEPLVLKEKSREVSAKLTPDEAKRIVPLRDDPLNGETDVLQAFLNYLA
ncbi:MAG: type III-B CRISPR module RAMP protein Cmr1 [Chloroflexi bacterium AL-W]|nr:type III-B CRISPR module RAMP protein Cmr1 [Chloroflexi bacterium AL-N1]NOK66639.1 type III-B CRISPR module RAMP protein Cmr1 [Chloroflexi bacterium AL-N10]NOK72027.1 type III-B CRISPR module RAMP protein Cmr1 [Chloroflexi bacterium AL-N5]NOK81284.1 type III-B CRISPR module RAMP protein Cmr1 [Chloroflexi bacterium AL-W]NOK89557.1 type III-B CRISPR module RAMP protein Cmr1 [Chloroflexi bacterium AL-N15]